MKCIHELCLIPVANKYKITITKVNKLHAVIKAKV